MLATCGSGLCCLCIGLHKQLDPRTCTMETTARVQSSTPTLAVDHLMYTVTCLCLLRVEWHVTQQWDSPISHAVPPDAENAGSTFL